MKFSNSHTRRRPVGCTRCGYIKKNDCARSFFFIRVWCNVTQCVSKTMYLGSSPSALAKRRNMTVKEWRRVVKIKYFEKLRDETDNEIAKKRFQEQVVRLKCELK